MSTIQNLILFIIACYILYNSIRRGVIAIQPAWHPKQPKSLRFLKWQLSSSLKTLDKEQISAPVHVWSIHVHMIGAAWVSPTLIVTKTHAWQKMTCRYLSFTICPTHVPKNTIVNSSVYLHIQKNSQLVVPYRLKTCSNQQQELPTSTWAEGKWL